MASRSQSQHAQKLLPRTWSQVHSGAISQQHPFTQNLHLLSNDDSANLAGLSLTDAEIDDEIQEFE